MSKAKWWFMRGALRPIKWASEAMALVGLDYFKPWIYSVLCLAWKSWLPVETGTVFTREQSAQFELSFELPNLNYAVYTREKLIAIFELRSVHTRDRNCGFAFQSRRNALFVSGYPANQTYTELTFPVLLYIMQCKVYRRKWLEGHVAPPPKSQVLRSRHSYGNFAAWFERCVTGKHLRTVIWIVHFKLRIAM